MSSSARPSSSQQRPSSSSRPSGSRSDQQRTSSSSKSAAPEKEAEPEEVDERTPEQVRQDEFDVFIKTSMTTHLDFLGPPLITLSSAFNMPVLHVALCVAPIIVLLHVSLASALQKHFTYFLLLVPLRCTLHSIADESGSGRGVDAPQWLGFWLFWFTFQGVSGWVKIWRPGWEKVVSLGGLVGLVTMGGPWWSKAGLRSSVSSDLRNALEREKKAEVKRRGDEAKTAKDKRTLAISTDDQTDKDKQRAKAKADAARRAGRSGK
ncbi:hypothetical protein TREMEDRAFT_62637 [Tremella mesenterica DSM 1558]|uniref:uncharacterized protein n=1 Tax=Tremella mesenterica (strain ATCC 24925 / CBS 8224 / DSM 1558 / NBRC 9311 / NRRL Y-6157 / RJB 2259-6 / UBC 559-6) TaxID=578456 RepID=UPI0003F495A4|nr:uncharacterized protein TREMEDRAFT_62637 [Tremella mesenterica DSM 1558]EIW68919.1 hypothetical protein TREMEDRAFT_62637 [Tremella mesenterica DSM 1558]